MKKALFAIFALVLVVCLTSCGEDKEIGSYDIESITKDGETMTAKEIKDQLAEYGMDIDVGGLILNKDGTGKMSLMGESQDIKWDAKAKTMTANGETLNYTFKDNKISMGEDGDGMVFVKKN